MRARDTPTVTPDASLDSLFANQVGPGWVGGDATYSTALPYGQEAFDFSDTLIGSAQSNGSASLTGIPHNTEMVGDMPNLASDYGGSYGAPEALIPDSGNDSWQVAGTYMENGRQLIFVNEFARRRKHLRLVYGPLRHRRHVIIERRTLFSYLTLVPSDPDTQWGNAVMQSDGYDYIYGIDDTSTTFYGMKVARAPSAESLDTTDWTLLEWV